MGCFFPVPFTELLAAAQLPFWDPLVTAEDPVSKFRSGSNKEPILPGSPKCQITFYFYSFINNKSYDSLRLPRPTQRVKVCEKGKLNSLHRLIELKQATPNQHSKGKTDLWHLI